MTAPRSPGKQTPQQMALGFERIGLVAGVDEAGRGPLAGPVVAAAVILDDLQPIVGLDDSKKLSPKRREALYEQIRGRALACCIAQASVEEIDRLNILHATMLAMKRAVEGLRLKPARVLVDGNRVPVLRIPAEAIVGGDAKVQAISAASILAKVYRDRLCLQLHEAWPHYAFDVHKGYPTALHLAALAQHGPCPEHRRSYAPVRLAELGVLPGSALALRTALQGDAAIAVVDRARQAPADPAGCVDPALVQLQDHTP
jgi:ribonuclease HII